MTYSMGATGVVDGGQVPPELEYFLTHMFVSLKLTVAFCGVLEVSTVSTGIIESICVFVIGCAHRTLTGYF